MKQRFWILNVCLLLLLCTLLGFVLFYKVHLPNPYSIGPIAAIPPTTQQKVGPIDLEKIWRHDLFSTYITPTLAKPTKPDYIKQIPTPPEPVTVAAPAIEAPKFIDPLALTLTGVFMFNDDAKNRAIIMYNKSKEEITYKVGDEIDDAQIVKIFSNKVLLIRSNGQQETIYLSQDDANADTSKYDKKEWKHVVKKISDNSYIVDPQEFANEVKSLSNLIDLFDLSVAYKQGKSLGTKIGTMDQQSLASAFGFNAGDIITAIDNMPVATNIEQRAAYQKISTLIEQDTLTLSVIRNNEPITITIKLETITPPLLPLPTPTSQTQPTLAQQRREQNTADDESIKLLQKKEKFAPTLRELQLQEKKNILRHQRAVEAQKSGKKD